MDAKAIHALTDFVRALTALVQVLGAWPLTLLLIAAGLIFVGIPWWREHLRNKKVDLVIEHKEKEVQRLADDNRMYREVYLAQLGYPKGLLSKDAEDSRDAKEERKPPAK